MTVSTFEKIILKNLDHDERLLWSGRPRQGIIFRPADSFLFAFSSVFIIIPLFLMCMVFYADPDTNVIFLGKSVKMGDHIFYPSFFIAFFSIFLVVGLYIGFGRFFFDSHSRKRLFYGVTNRRAIIVQERRRPIVTSYEIETLNNLHLVEHGNNRGTIGLSGKVPPDYIISNSSHDDERVGPDYDSTFYQIDDAAKVMHVLQEQRQELKRR